MIASNDPELKSFITVPEDSPFPIQNIPFGIFRPKIGGSPRVGTAIGPYVVDLAELEDIGLFDGPELDGERVFNNSSLNDFIALGKKAWREAREKISILLRSDEPTIRDHETLRNRIFFKHEEVEMLDPVDIGDYTEFNSSLEHVKNIGSIYRGSDQALEPVWKQQPLASHGRSSSVTISGTDIIRPHGQKRSGVLEKPSFGPSEKLDFELELGFFVGPGNKFGEPIPVNEAEHQIFGMVLANNWSARDIQYLENGTLSSFLGKNFATSLAPWIVTIDALEPFRAKPVRQDPLPPSYLIPSHPHTYDIDLSVMISPYKHDESYLLSRTNFRYLYWTPAQQIAHHTINGCNLRPGDLLTTGAISSGSSDGLGSMMELTMNGTNPITLSADEERAFLENGDTIIMSAACSGNGYHIGFGEVKGTVKPAISI